MAGRVTSPRFVGRADELATIAGALERAAAGETTHLLVAGEAGVGKTRLIAETVSMADRAGFRVLRGQCVAAGETGLPYGPIVEALRGLVRDIGGGEARGLAGRSAPDLARLVPAFGAGEPGSAQGEWARTHLFEAVLGLLERLAERSPVLLVIEDLHWADAGTRELLSFLVGGLQGVPVVLVVSYRSDELHRRHPLLPWLAELDRAQRVTRIQLARLDRDQLAALLEGIRGVAPDVRLVTEIHARSDGNPFFAEELLAAADQGGPGGLTPTLREILLTRIARLPEHARSMLEVAAVAGRTVDHDLLVRVADLDEREVLDGLRVAVAEHVLVVEEPDEADRYAFRHALVQEAAYDELLPGDRRRLHRSIAAALEPDSADDVEVDAVRWAELAHHWAMAREDERAFDASLRAADASLGSSAFAGSLASYERVLDLWDRVDDPEGRSGVDRAEIHRRAGLAAHLAPEFRRAVVHRRAAVALVDRQADPLRAGLLMEQLGRSLYVMGEPSQSRDAYLEALATIPAEPPTAERARALSGYGQILMLLGNHVESVPLCREAIEVARTAGARVQEGHARNTLGLNLAVLGQCEEGVRELQEAIEIARDAGNGDDIGRGYINLGETLNGCGQTEAALELSLEGIDVAADFGLTYSSGYYILLHAISFAASLGRTDEARAILDRGLTGAPTDVGSTAYRLQCSMPLLVMTGDPGVRLAIEEAAALHDDERGAQFIGPVAASIAEQSLWDGAPDAALATIERAMTRLEGFSYRAEAARVCRVGAWAAADVAEAARVARDAAREASARAALATMRAQLAAALATGVALNAAFEADLATIDAEAQRLDGVPAVEAWLAVAERWDAVPRPYLAALARYRAGEAAVVAGPREIAVEALRAADAGAERIGALPLRDAIRLLARRARIGLDSASTAPAEAGAPASAGFGLTPRELDVLALVADGRTNRQIAEALFITESTAGVHVSNILAKLGVATRTEAAALAIRLRIVDPGRPAG